MDQMRQINQMAPLFNNIRSKFKQNIRKTGLELEEQMFQRKNHNKLNSEVNNNPLKRKMSQQIFLDQYRQTTENLQKKQSETGLKVSAPQEELDKNNQNQNQQQALLKIDSNLNIQEQSQIKEGLGSSLQTSSCSSMENSKKVDDVKEKNPTQSSLNVAEQPKQRRPSMFLGNNEVDTGTIKAIGILTMKEDKAESIKRSSNSNILNNNKKDKKKLLKLNYLNKDNKDYKQLDVDKQQETDSERQLEGGTQEQKDMYHKFKKNEPAKSLIKEYITIKNLRESNCKKLLQTRIKPCESHLYKYLVYIEKQNIIESQNQSVNQQQNINLDNIFSNSNNVENENKNQQNQVKSNGASPLKKGRTFGNNLTIGINKGFQENHGQPSPSPIMMAQSHYFNQFNQFTSQNKYCRNTQKQIKQKQQNKNNQYNNMFRSQNPNKFMQNQNNYFNNTITSDQSVLSPQYQQDNHFQLQSPNKFQNIQISNNQNNKNGILKQTSPINNSAQTTIVNNQAQHSENFFKYQQNENRPSIQEFLENDFDENNKNNIQNQPSITLKY